MGSGSSVDHVYSGGEGGVLASVATMVKSVGAANIPPCLQPQPYIYIYICIYIYIYTSHITFISELRASMLSLQ